MATPASNKNKTRKRTTDGLVPRVTQPAPGATTRTLDVSPAQTADRNTGRDLTVGLDTGSFDPRRLRARQGATAEFVPDSTGRAAPMVTQRSNPAFLPPHDEAELEAQQAAEAEAEKKRKEDEAAAEQAAEQAELQAIEQAKQLSQEQAAAELAAQQAADAAELTAQEAEKQREQDEIAQAIAAEDERIRLEKEREAAQTGTETTVQSSGGGADEGDLIPSVTQDLLDQAVAEEDQDVVGVQDQGVAGDQTGSAFNDLLDYTSTLNEALASGNLSSVAGPPPVPALGAIGFAGDGSFDLSIDALFDAGLIADGQLVAGAADQIRTAQSYNVAKQMHSIMLSTSIDATSAANNAALQKQLVVLQGIQQRISQDQGAIDAQVMANLNKEISLELGRFEFEMRLEELKQTGLANLFTEVQLENLRSSNLFDNAEALAILNNNAELAKIKQQILLQGTADQALVTKQGEIEQDNLRLASQLRISEQFASVGLEKLAQMDIISLQTDENIKQALAIGEATQEDKLEIIQTEFDNLKELLELQGLTAQEKENMLRLELSLTGSNAEALAIINNAARMREIIEQGTLDANLQKELQLLELNQRDTIARLVQQGALDQIEAQKLADLDLRTLINDQELQNILKLEEEQTADLPPSVTDDFVTDELPGRVTEIKGSINDVLALPPGNDKLAAMRDVMANTEPFLLPSELQWDSQSGQFVDRPGAGFRQRTPELQEYLRQVQDVFMMRDSMQVAIEREAQFVNDMARQQAERDAAAADFQRQMSTGDIDSADEALARQRQAEAALVQAQADLLPMQMLMELLGNPLALASARQFGLLDQIEETLGVKIPFRNSTQAKADGSLPGPEAWGQLSDTQRVLIRAEWMAANGGTEDDFANAMRAQTPGQAGQGTLVTRI